MILTVANQKGGVAKTTTSVNLAACFAEQGKRTLLVDMDPQGGDAVCLGMDTTVLERSIYDALVKPGVTVSDVLVSTNFGFDLAPRQHRPGRRGDRTEAGARRRDGAPTPP